MHQSFETPAPPPFGLERGIHFLCKWKWVKSPVPGDKSEWYFSTHGTTFVKQLIIAKRNTLVKKHCWQPWNKQIDLWATSKLPGRGCEDCDFKGTKMRCIGGESPRNPPLRPEWGGGGGGFQMTGALDTNPLKNKRVRSYKNICLKKHGLNK